MIIERRSVLVHGVMFLAIVVGAGSAPRPVQATPYLVENHQAKAEIVIADNPPRMVKLAAEELQTYVERISGARLPITNAPGKTAPVQVYVGRSPYTDRLNITDDGLKYGAFKMVSGRNWLVLLGHDSDFKPREPFHAGGRIDASSPALVEWDKKTGTTWGFPLANLFKEYSGVLGIWEKDERGSLNAVYEFLRQQGVRWYLPDPLGEIVPRKASIALPEVNRTVRPDFPERYPMQYGRMFSNPGSTRDEVLWQLRLGLNNGPDPVGSVELAIAHGMRPLLERPEMKKAHPEYYALYGGKRDLQGGHPCLSSEGLFREHVRYVRTVFDLYDVPMVSLMPEDGYGNLCECDLCKGKDAPQRGWTGHLSEHVWDYVNRVAGEILKSHPDKKLSCMAYGAYLLPPEKIATLSPNIVVGICQNRSDFYDRQVREHFVAIRDGWLKKAPNSQLLIGDYYLNARPNMPWEGIPVIYPRLIAEDLRSLKGISLGNFIEVYRDPKGIHSLALDHLALYLTARGWWDADLDVNALLEEYYTLYYGPAREEMKTFIEYSETNWMDMAKNAAKIDKVFELLANARQKAPADSVYAKRIDLIADYIHPMKALREQLAKGRKDAPNVRAYWRDTAVTIDGKLDEPFWQVVPWNSLSDLETGRESVPATAVKVAWSGDSLYFGITCQDRDAPALNIGTTNSQDQSLWNGDCIEIHLETQTHSYYQIAVNPAGAVVSLDRKKGAIDDRWTANAQVVTLVGRGVWTVEIRVPVPGEQQEQIDPRNGVSGKQPTETYPWYFNVFRQRIRDESCETSAFVPIGRPTFHDPSKFAAMYVR